jgi:hypothetical protein
MLTTEDYNLEDQGKITTNQEQSVGLYSTKRVQQNRVLVTELITAVNGLLTEFLDSMVNAFTGIELPDHLNLGGVFSPDVQCKPSFSKMCFHTRILLSPTYIPPHKIRVEMCKHYRLVWNINFI